MEQTQYNVIATLRTPLTDELADHVLGGDLAAYHAVMGTDHRDRAQIILTIAAEDLAQASVTARTLLAAFPDQARLDIMTTQEYDDGDAHIPPLVSVSQAAESLGITRQAVLGQITRGSLRAATVGKTYAISAASVKRSGKIRASGKFITKPGAGGRRSVQHS